MTNEGAKKGRTIALDFDGVLNSYKAWSGPTGIDDPVPGAKEFCVWLRDQGFDLVVMTTRAEWEEGRRAIKDWLEFHGFPEMRVTNEKVAAMVYL